MKRRYLKVTWIAAAVAAAIFAAGPAVAGKPSRAGGGNHSSHGHKNEHHTNGEHGSKGEHQAKGGKHFDDNGRNAVREYFDAAYRSGNCPPGLAKKHNGCMPPGQAKQWSMNQPLPKGVVTYDLPPELVVKIGIPPVGYKYLRVANDILMVAAGTNMVVDAINDLGK